VSKSAYYLWKKRGITKREEEEYKLMRKIEDIHKSSRGTYGSPRILAELKGLGIPCSKSRLERLMKKNGIRAKTRKKFRVTTDSKHKLPVAANILDRNFSPQATNMAWAGDITYIETKEGWLFLAVIIDLFSRRVVGWSMGDRITRELTLNALRMAIRLRNPGVGLVHHTDRGSQYASYDYQNMLKAHKMICSMSRKGNCWDNAVVESFFHSLKTEMIYWERFETREEAKRKVFEWIEVFYNRKRRHSTIGNLSPANFEVESLKQCA
jgi:transposase InsO family protein